ncbi:MAG: hypothetical protein U0359_26605 [Byssovorax sp.]
MKNMLCANQGTICTIGSRTQQGPMFVDGRIATNERASTESVVSIINDAFAKLDGGHVRSRADQDQALYNVLRNCPQAFTDLFVEPGDLAMGSHIARITNTEVVASTHAHCAVEVTNDLTVLPGRVIDGRITCGTLHLDASLA